MDGIFNDPSILKYGTDVDFNDKKLGNIKFVKVNYQLAVNSHLTPKRYVDNAIHEIFFVKNNCDNNYNKFSRTNKNSITLNTQTTFDNKVKAKSYVDQFHQQNEQFGPDSWRNFYNESRNQEIQEKVNKTMS